MSSAIVMRVRVFTENRKDRRTQHFPESNTRSRKVPREPKNNKFNLFIKRSFNTTTTMLEKISEFIDVKDYRETFEANLNKDEIAKVFWFSTIKSLINKFAKQALENEGSETSEKSAAQYKNEYSLKVEELMENNQSFLSVRNLLELNEVYLKKNGFEDVWRRQKTHENSQALKLLSKRLSEIDLISDRTNRWKEIIRGMLAGNIFDSGATAVQDLLEDNKNFGLEEALEKIPERPWLIDSFDDFISRFKSGVPHKCAVIFCDNSGVDLILGVLPFARELLRNNTKVILSANSEPALNDITFSELVGVVELASNVCAIIRESLKSKKLMLSASGQKGCCLNFLSLDENLVELMIDNKVDLIIIEGMGRSLHTNLNSKFRVDSLKVAVIKNKFLASRLGGNLFDAICKFEASPIK